MALSDRNSYGNILRSIGIFGGTKIFQIIIGLVRNKCIAILLGPVGMGISGILTSTTGMISAITGFGLHTSSVRDIAKAYETGDEQHIGEIKEVFRKLVWFTGILGSFITILFAPILSQLSFGNEEYTMAFRLVSIIVLLDQLCVGQTAIMQGTFHYKYMAESSLWGSIIGLLISVPLYYLWGESAIVPVIIIASLTHLLLSTYYSRKIYIKKAALSHQGIWKLGKGMLILGFAIALSSFVGTGQTYILRVSISRIGSISDVGLYTAGIAIVTQYINVLLQAMGSDYSPRLASVSDSNDLFIDVINRQIKLMLTIVTPLIVPFVVFIRPVTILLYSDKFLPIQGMIEWMMIGMFFRTVSWCLSYSMIARGESKQFFYNETLACLYGIIFTIVGFYYGSFTGIGVAFCVEYIVYTIQMFILCRNNFSFFFDRQAIRMGVLLFCVVLFSYIAIVFCNTLTMRYVVGSLFSITVMLISINQLNRLIPIKSIIKQILNKFIKK